MSKRDHSKVEARSRHRLTHSAAQQPRSVEHFSQRENQLAAGYVRGRAHLPVRVKLPLLTQLDVP